MATMIVMGSTTVQVGRIGSCGRGADWIGGGIFGRLLENGLLAVWRGLRGGGCRGGR